MFGRIDIVVRLPFGPGPGDLAFILGLLREEWPEAVVDDLSRSNPDPVPISQLFPVRPSEELLVYRSPREFQSWQRSGATTRNGGSLIHILLDDEDMTFVVDRPRSRTAKMVDDLIEMLRRNRMIDCYDARRIAA